MDWTVGLTIIGVLVALFAAMTTLIIWVVNKLDSDIKNVGEKIDRAVIRLDGHATRIDQLYNIIIDMLKAGK